MVIEKNYEITKWLVIVVFLSFRVSLSCLRRSYLETFVFEKKV